MIVFQIVIDDDGRKVDLMTLAREDATKQELRISYALEDMMLKVLNKLSVDEDILMLVHLVGKTERMKEKYIGKNKEQ